MKKLSFIFMCIAALSFFFVGCSPEDPKPPVEIVEDGLYLSGEATSSVDLKTENLMAPGINEQGQKLRNGMYEKYVALEAGKTFTITQVKGSTKTIYGAALTEADPYSTDNEPAIKVLRGTYSEGGAALKVNKSGLYHVIMEDSLKTVVIAPVEWGVRGAMNGWGFTAFPAPTFNKTSMTYTLEDVSVASAGGFKFAYGAGWKLRLDPDGKVQANTNLGNNNTEQVDIMSNNLLQGGKDINIARGIFKIVLTWNLKDGDAGKSFTATVTKTGDMAMSNFTNAELELVGSGVDPSNPGAKADATSGWNWGYTLSAGKPTKSGNVYTWTWNSVKLLDQGFKIRTIDAKESGGIAGFDVGYSVVDQAASPNVVDDGGNIKVNTAGTYKIVMTIDAGNEDARKVVITKL